MICSTCDTEVDEYYRGRQCKRCFRIPQRAWREKDRDKENVKARKRYWKDPKKHSKSVLASKKKRLVHYLVQHRLRDKYNIRRLRDTYIKKLIKRSWPNKNFRIITDQEIKERRQQVIRCRRKKQIKLIKREYTETVSMVICPLVKREIPMETCHNMQAHYEKCQGCEHMTKIAIGELN